MTTQRFTTTLALLTLLFTLSSVGCVSPNMLIGGLPLYGGQPEKPEDSEESFGSRPHYRVSLYTASAKPEQTTRPLTGPVFTSAVLKELGALKKFSKPRIFVMRTAANGQRHRLEVDYNPVKERIQHAFDYSIRNGDHIIVSEDNREDPNASMLSRLMPQF